MYFIQVVYLKISFYTAILLVQNLTAGDNFKEWFNEKSSFKIDSFTSLFFVLLLKEHKFDSFTSCKIGESHSDNVDAKVEFESEFIWHFNKFCSFNFKFWFERILNCGKAKFSPTLFNVIWHGKIFFISFVLSFFFKLIHNDNAESLSKIILIIKWAIYFPKLLLLIILLLDKICCFFIRLNLLFAEILDLVLYYKKYL